ncbi:OmpA family protein [Variovorax sp. ZT5P30]|uniref:OmpA family protein n=1 Tax=Variovorax sp. ZT5P30 TaxID=3443735 RepID=UPI003F46C495
MNSSAAPLAAIRIAMMLPSTLACSVALATTPLHMTTDVWFKENSSLLEPNAVVELERLVCKLKGGRVDVLRLYAHAAKGEGNPENLALDRALAVRALMLASPAAIEHIVIRNGSDTEPVKSNATEAGRAANRHVELEVSFAKPPMGWGEECGPRGQLP